jgi:hypothetical protein
MSFECELCISARSCVVHARERRAQRGAFRVEIELDVAGKGCRFLASITFAALSPCAAAFSLLCTGWLDVI